MTLMAVFKTLVLCSLMSCNFLPFFARPDVAVGMIGLLLIAGLLTVGVFPLTGLLVPLSRRLECSGLRMPKGPLLGNRPVKAVESLSRRRGSPLLYSRLPYRLCSLSLLRVIDRTGPGGRVCRELISRPSCYRLEN